MTNESTYLDILDPSVKETITSRRAALQKAGKLGAGFALASIPAMFGMIPKTAAAQDASDAVAVLKYALTLEYLEESYYRQGLASAALQGQSLGQTVYGLLQKHEESHVNYLRSVIGTLGGEPVEFEDDDFDFTAGGNFDPFNDYPTYLILSQAFEDTGVRAYKGQAGAVSQVSRAIGTDLLTPALQIHALEARHAAEVRSLRARMGADIKPWITLNDLGGAPEAVAPVYAGEEATTQADADVTFGGRYTPEEASEAFDEPLTMEDGNAIAGLFLAS